MGSSYCFVAEIAKPKKEGYRKRKEKQGGGGGHESRKGVIILRAITRAVEVRVGKGKGNMLMGTGAMRYNNKAPRTKQLLPYIGCHGQVIGE